MKEVQLNRGYIALVDDEDFEKVSQFKWSALVDKRKKDGSIKNVYAIRGVCTGKTETMHRFITGNTETDHVDHNGLNNQRQNLRRCTSQQNRCNRVKAGDNTSGYKGVHWCKQTSSWMARIEADNIRLYLGRFSTALEAANAYDAAALKYHKDFALTNAMIASFVPIDAL